MHIENRELQMKYQTSMESETLKFEMAVEKCQYLDMERKQHELPSTHGSNHETKCNTVTNYLGIIAMDAFSCVLKLILVDTGSSYGESHIAIRFRMQYASRFKNTLFRKFFAPST